MLNGFTFEQLKSLIQTDFFDIDQIKTIKSCLEENRPIELSLTEAQLKQLANISQLET